MEIKNMFKKIQTKIQNSIDQNPAFSRTDKKRLQKLERFQACNITFFGKKLTIVDSLTFLSSYNEIFNGEIYKFKHKKPDTTILDCGANIGLATIYFKMNYPNARIIAFEPDPNIFRALKNNIESFGLTQVICQNQAISNRNNLVNFRMEGGHSGMITPFDGGDTLTVKALRLKSVLEKYENITFLKIDIEGEEINVIPDIEKELLKVDYMFVEYHSFVNSPQKLCELLGFIEAAGMRYYIKESAEKLHPFMERELFLNMDMIVNIFCYR